MATEPLVTGTLYFLCNDVARMASEAGLTMRTPAAVRAAVRARNITPSGITPGGVYVWTEEKVAESLRILAHVKMLREKADRFLLECAALRDPVQLTIKGGE